VSGPDGATINSSTGLLSWTPTEVQGPGTYNVTVQVNDNVGGTDQETFVIEVREVNIALNLQAISDQIIDELTEFTITAVATDEDQPANTLVYSLTMSPPNATIDSSSGLIRWTPSEADGPGVGNFEVRVTDSVGGFDTESFSVTVNEVNLAPILATIPTQRVDEFALLSVELNATDADLPANTLVYSIVSGPDGASIDSGSGRFTWTPTEDQGPGTYNITVQVDDQAGGTDQESFVVEVREVNVAPNLQAISDQIIDELTEFTITAVATDEDRPANSLMFSLTSSPTGATIDSTSGQIRWTPSETDGPGSAVFEVRVTDSAGGFDTESFTVTVNEVNVDPVLEAISAQTVDELALLQVQLTATDADLPANTLTYTIVSGPDGATINSSTGLLSWTPTEVQGPGTYNVTVQVNDNVGGTDETSFGIEVREVNVAPELAPINDQSIDELVEITIVAVATDADDPANTLVYSLDAAPTGATIDSSSGQFRWTPTEAQGPGAYPVTVRVFDDNNGVDTESFTVTVREVNTPPVLAAITNHTIDELTELSIQLVATDVDLPANTLTYTLVTGPTGAVVDPSTGRFRWAPTEAQGPGDYPVTVRVSDGSNGSDAESFTVTVREVNLAPLLSDSLTQSVVRGSELTVVYTATDPDLPPNDLIFSIVGDARGATIVPASGRSAEFHWSPDETVAPGIYQFTIRVTDDGTPAGSDETTLSVEVLSSDCEFDANLTGWMVTENGGSSTGRGGVTSVSCEAMLVEGDSFRVALEQSFVVPAGATSLSFEYAGLAFDLTDPAFVNDAFEASLLDPTGASLVPTFSGASGVDAFFNVSEDVGVATGTGVTVVGNFVTVSLASVAVGTTATLRFRLANNDTDNGTSVRIVNVTLPEGVVASEVVDGVVSGQSLSRSTGVASPQSVFNSAIRVGIAETSPSPHATPFSSVGVVDSIPIATEWRRGRFGGDESRSFSVLPHFSQVAMTPVVIDLDGDRKPEIVFSTFDLANPDGATNPGVLRAIRGDDGNDFWTNSEVQVEAFGSIAAGDIDLDGKPEIIAHDTSGRVLAFNSDGTLKWTSLQVPGGIGWGGASIANIDSVGTPEIVVGSTVLDFDGRIRWSGTEGRGGLASGIYPLSVVADVDLDGRPEVIAGNTIYQSDGSVVRRFSVVDGFTAVGNFDSDRSPEIVLVSQGTVSLLNPDNPTPTWQVSIPGGGHGGPPTIADFDGDGEPEIGVAGATRYVAFNSDGTVKWSVPIQDGSSNVTGSSVFDLDGDGAVEVLYGDETAFRIYRGADGHELAILSRGSGTTFELPVVADANDDGTADIVVIANEYFTSGASGIIVLRSGGDPWSNTRPIWNQHSYHITNINDDGTIPAVELNSWELYNNYRRNQQITGTAIFPPTISASAPTSSSAVGSTVVLTGRGAANGTLPTGSANRIASVEINGTALDVLDVNGNFFAAVQVLPGENRYRFTAYDAVGQTVSTEVVVTGTQDSNALDFSRYADITGSFTGVYGRTSFKEDSDFLLVELATRNDGTFATDVPLLVGVKNLRTRGGRQPTVSLVGADGVMSDGTPYFDFSQYVANQRLGPGQETGSPVIAFHNPNRERFDYDLVFYGRLNEAPVITSVPDVEALIGKAYAYPVTAVDDDSDTLVYRLLETPDATMQIDSATGLITWTPTANQQGNHTVVVQVDDNRGGLAEQRYALSVIPAPPNRPPVITSTPVTTADVVMASSEEEVVVDVRGWSPISLIDLPNPSQWIVTDDGTSATQLINGYPTALLSDFVASQERIRGTWRVNSNSDNDFMGFVFGYLDSTHFYLFDWKAGTQVSDFGAVGLAGMSVKRIAADSVLTDNDLWETAGSPDRVTSLYYNDAPWGSFTDYSFDLKATEGRFTIIISQAGVILNTIEITDDQFTPGKFGFYNSSQDSVVYQGFTRSQIPELGYSYNVEALDPDHDALTYAFVTKPDGMAINPQTGLISWAPTIAQVGDHTVKVEVADGRGGVATQEFVVCVKPDPNNHAPIITSEPITKATIDAAYQYRLEAIDPDEDQMSYSLVSGPSGMTIDANTGVITWNTGSLGENLVDNGDFERGDAGFASQLRSDIWPGNPGSYRIGTDPFQVYGSINPNVGSYGDHTTGTGIMMVVNGSEDPSAINWQQTVTVESGKTYEFFAWASTTYDVAPAQLRFKINGETVGTPLMLPTPEGFWQRFYVHWNSATATTATIQITNDQDAGLGNDFALDDIGFAEVIAGSTVPVSVRVEDVRGGFDEQSFSIEVKATGTGEIRGTKFNDADGDGVSVRSVDFIDAFDNGSSPLWGNEVGEWRVVNGQYDATLDSNNPLPYSSLPYELTDIDLYFDVVDQSRAAVWLRSPEFGRGIVLAVGGSSQSSLYWHIVTEGTGDLVGYPIVGEVTNALTTGETVSVHVKVRGDVYEVFLNGSATPTATLVNSSFPIGRVALGDHGARAFDNVRLMGKAADDGLGNWTIYLDQNDNGRQDIGEASTTTDANGVYAFTGLPAGTYIVREEPQSGWRQTYPLSVSSAHEVALADGEVIAGVDFGNTQLASGPNENPAFESTPPNTTPFGELFRYDAIASDPESDQLVYDLVAGPTGMTLNPQTGTVVWQPQESQLGEHSIVLRVEDGRGGVDVQQFTLAVVAPNTAPVFTSLPGATAVQGKPYVYDLSLQDADEDLVFVTLDAGSIGTLTATEVLGPDNEPLQTRYRLTWTPSAADLAAGKGTIRLRADDGRGGVTLQTMEVNVVATAANTAPVIASTPRTVARPGVPYAYVVDASDTNSDPLTYSLDPAAQPVGMTISPTTGLITWTPSTTATGSHPVRVHVSDGTVTTAQEYAISIASQIDNRGPSILSNPPQSGREGKAYVYDAEATDVDGDPVRWTLDAAPIGMSLNADNGAIRWTPRVDQIGTHQVVLRATDPLGATTIQSFAIEVNCTNTPPLILSTPPTQAAVGEVYFYAVRAVDPDGDALTLSLPGSPDDMSISPSGLIRWTPAVSDQGETRNVVVRADDGDGGFAIQEFKIEVTAATNLNRGPTITSSPEFATTLGDEYRYQVDASDPDGDTLTYSLPTKPAWLNIDPATGLITGTPLNEEVVAVVVEVTDGTAKTTQGFAINVRANRAPTISSTPALTAIVGGVYRYTVNASDPEGDALSYSLISGPTGMTIDGFGRIVWNVPVDFSTTMPADVQIRVSDPRGAVASQDFAITVAADTTAPSPVVDVRLGARFVGSTESVDLNAALTVRVSAYDNVGVVRRTLEIDGQLVPLNEQGEYSLTANLLGPLTFVAKAYDAAGNEGITTRVVQVVNAAGRGGNNPTVGDPTLPARPTPIPGDTAAPEVVITSPLENASVTSITSIVGTIDDAADNLWFWRTFVARPDLVNLAQLDLNDPDLRLIGQGSTEINNAEIAKFDPSGLANDPYAIIVVAFDAGGRGNVAVTTVGVEGNLKLGQFRLEFADLSIPLSGIPIEITRVYDTHDAGRQGDFGYGWTLGVKDARILEVGATGEYDTFVPDKTKVYLTSPSGQRVSFTYKERFKVGTLFGPIFTPYFQADPGVYDTLTIDETEVTRGGLLGALGGEGINPDNYTLTTAAGTKYRYNQTTGLQTITDLNGNTVTFTDAGIQHSSGVEVTFQRDNRGRITAINSPDGQTLRYAYNAAGDLASFTSQAELTTTFAYRTTPAHYLDEIMDPLGRRAVKTEYDDQGRILRTIDAAGNVVEYDHSLDGFERVRDAAGNVTLLKYDPYGNVTEERRGEHTITIPAGGTQTVYDSIVRTQYIHERDGVSSSNRDKEWKVTQVFLDPLGATVKETTTEYDYDARGNVVKVTDFVGGQTLTREFAYDAKNNVTHVKDELGRQTNFTYDAAGNLREVVNAEGKKASTVFDAQGRVTSYTDFAGNTTTFVYQGSNPQPSEIRNPGHTDTASNVRKFEYNALGQTTKITDEEGIVSVYEYDPQGRQTYEQVGTDAPVRSVYLGQNLARRIVARSEVEPGATDLVTEYGYTATDLLQYEIDPLGAVTGYEYDANGNRTFLGRWNTKADYEADQAAKTVNPATVFAGRYPKATFEHVFVYDRLGRVDYELDDVQLALAEQANLPLDQITVRLDYNYDSAGNRTEVIDRNGRKRTFQYDERNRQIGELWWQLDVGTGQEEVIRSFSWVYCTCGQISTATEYDGPAATSPILSKYAYTYDLLGRLTSVDNAGTADMPHVVLTYDYDSNGNQTRVEDNLGVAVVSTYDSQNRLKTRAWDNKIGIDPAAAVDEVMVEFDYYLNGTQKELRRFDLDDTTGAKTLVGRTLYSSLDASGRVQTISHRDALDQAIAEYDYGFDQLGLVKSLAYNNRDDQYDFEVAYDYDDLGQLTGADYSEATAGRGIYQDELYNYDRNGNRVASHLHGSGYVTGPGNQLLSDGTFNYAYDNDGNQIRKTEIATGEVTVFEYDYRNLMTRATRYSQAPESGGVILAESTNRYDVEGQRISFGSDDDGVGPKAVYSTRVVYDGTSVWADFSPSNASISRYLLSSSVDQMIATDSSAGRATAVIAFPLLDHLSTARDSVALDGLPTTHTAFDSFGDILLSAPSGDTHRFAFTGREFDAISNSYHYRSRIYNAHLGRFTSTDPIGFMALDPNLYRYASNTPSMRIDPTGAISILGFTIGVGTVLTVGAAIGLGVGSAAEEYIVPIAERAAAEAASANRLSCVEEDALRHAIAGFMVREQFGALVGNLFVIFGGAAREVFDATPFDDWVNSVAGARLFSPGKNATSESLGALRRGELSIPSSGSRRGPNNEYIRC
jgi:RHS repeat-associated protein